MFQYQIPRSKHRFCIGSMRFGILNGEYLCISKVLGMNIGCLENHHLSTWVRPPPCVACHEPSFLLWFLPFLPPLPPVEPPWPPKRFHFPFPMIPFTSLRAMKRPRTAWQIQTHAQGENEMDWKVFQTIHPVPVKNAKKQKYIQLSLSMPACYISRFVRLHLHMCGSTGNAWRPASDFRRVPWVQNLYVYHPCVNSCHNRLGIHVRYEWTIVYKSYPSNLGIFHWLRCHGTLGTHVDPGDSIQEKIIVQIRLIRIQNHRVHEQEFLLRLFGKKWTFLILSARRRCPLGNSSIKTPRFYQSIPTRGISGSSFSSGSTRTYICFTASTQLKWHA